MGVTRAWWNNDGSVPCCMDAIAAIYDDIGIEILTRCIPGQLFRGPPGRPSISTYFIKNLICACMVINIDNMKVVNRIR